MKFCLTGTIFTAAYINWCYVGCNEWNAEEENWTKSVCLHSKSSVEGYLFDALERNSHKTIRK